MKRAFLELITLMVLIGLWFGVFPLSVYAISAFEKGESNKLSIGLGLGVPYGGLGGNFEVERNRFAISGGLGYDLAGLGWAVGVKAYLNELTKTFRLRASCFYGITSVVKNNDVFVVGNR